MASGTTAEPGRCTTRRRPSSSGTTASSPTTSTRCSRCRRRSLHRTGDPRVRLRARGRRGRHQRRARARPRRRRTTAHRDRGPETRRRARPARAWLAHNQAMLDLGATVYGEPEVRAVPASTSCAWRQASRPAPDPATRTALTSRPQARFKGSDREGRGRLLAAALDGPVRGRALAGATGWPEDAPRARRVADALVAEGLLEEVDGTWRIRAG